MYLRNSHIVFDRNAIWLSSLEELAYATSEQSTLSISGSS